MSSGRRHRVALEGFSPFERSALASYFRLAHHDPAYDQVEDIADADFIVADADHAGVPQAVIAAGRAGDTVFIGAHAPEGALAWMMRPIDPMHVMRELDAIVTLRNPGAENQPGPTRRMGPGRGGVPGRRAADGELSPSATPRAGADALVVDDSEIALRFLERHLLSLGMRPQRASSSAQALELLARQHFDFVFLDVELGDGSEVDGLALCQHIKQRMDTRGAPVPVVMMLSAHAQAVDRVRGTLAGCDAYLSKPLDAAELRRALARHGFMAAAATP